MTLGLIFKKLPLTSLYMSASAVHLSRFKRDCLELIVYKGKVEFINECPALVDCSEVAHKNLMSLL